MTSNSYAEFGDKNRRLLRQEELILEVTEAIVTALIESETKRVELAERLGTSKGYVSQLLDGDQNLTLRTLSDVADALGLRVRIKLESRAASFPAGTGWEELKVAKMLPFAHCPMAPDDACEFEATESVAS